MDATVLIMAAGRGTRMRSQVPKVLHPLCGRPLVMWPVMAAREAGASSIVVISSPGNGVEQVLPEGVQVALQQEPLGTGDAVKSALPHLGSDPNVIVLSGDHPLVEASDLVEMVKAHDAANAAATVATAELEDPHGYGRIVRNQKGDFERIVETKVDGDASDYELKINEVNTGTYCFNADDLKEGIESIANDNAQGEYYLGDLLPQLSTSGKRVICHRLSTAAAALGINTRRDLARLQAVARGRVLDRLMLEGVTITDPGSTYIEADVTVGADTTIEPYCFIRSGTVVGRGAAIGPMTTLSDCVIGDGCNVTHSYLDGCELLDGCSVGPFTYLRPGCELAAGVKAGAYVEIKKSKVGAGTKIPHLSYIGDADIGEQSNIAAGNITANYDGVTKHRTVIGNDVRTGVDTSFVAPVNVGDHAYTGAGSVITDDVPQGALGIARQRQENIEGFSDRKERRKKDKS